MVLLRGGCGVRTGESVASDTPCRPPPEILQTPSAEMSPTPDRPASRSKRNFAAANLAPQPGGSQKIRDAVSEIDWLPEIRDSLDGHR